MLTGANMQNTDIKGDGPGKYDAVCTVARGMVNAKSCIVIIHEGIFGSGFSVQAEESVIDQLPEMLENMAKQIRATNAKTRAH